MHTDRIIDFRYCPDRPQCCIGLIDDPHKTVVREDGSVNFGFENAGNLWYYDRCCSDAHPIHNRTQQNYGFRFRYVPAFTHRDVRISLVQDFGDPRAAIVETVLTCEASTLSWKVFAWISPDGIRADVIRWKLTAHEQLRTTHSTVVLLELGEPCDDSYEIVSVPGRTTRAPSAQPGEPFRFSAGEVREGAFFILHKQTRAEPANSSASDSAAPMPSVIGSSASPARALDAIGSPPTLETADAALRWAQQYWESAQPFRTAFEIPDPAIHAMLEACGRNILQAREVIRDAYCYQVGPSEYRGLWFVDGYFILESVCLMGRAAESNDGIQEILSHAHPDGSIQKIDRHDKETGVALATCIRLWELTGQDQKIADHWPLFRQCLPFIRSKRQEAAALGADYPAHDLFPPSSGDGGINVDPEYTTPLWIMHGLLSAYRAGHRLQLPDHEAFLTEYNSIMDAFLCARKRDLRTSPDGIPYLPMSMVTEHEILAKLRSGDTAGMANQEIYKPQTGIWALSQTIYPGEVFPPQSPIVEQLTALYETIDKKQGIPENTGWLPLQGIWPYSSMFDAHVLLYAGNAKKAVDYLYAFANHASPARCWREEQALAGTQSSEMCGDMPHNWGSAMFILLCRNLLLFETQDRLEIFAGLPTEWLPRDSQQLYLQDTPTRYGPVTLRLTATSPNSYTLQYSRNGTRHPSEIRLHWAGATSLSPHPNNHDDIHILSGDTMHFSAELFV